MQTDSSDVQDLKDIIAETERASQIKGTPLGICWDTSRSLWISYNLQDGLMSGQQAEFICFGKGVAPLPLTEIAYRAWDSVVRSLHSENAAA